MLAGLEYLASKVMLELLAENDRGFVRVTVASCSKSRACQSTAAQSGVHSPGGHGNEPHTSQSPSNTTLISLTAFRDGRVRRTVPLRTGSCVWSTKKSGHGDSTLRSRGWTDRIIVIDRVQEDNVFGDCDLEVWRREQRCEHVRRRLLPDLTDQRP